ncbi:TPA: hypothetical protein DCZ39_04260 [Patescibacteria group bacterium]|nr:hypothetical protein [Candidatus Gracilibacteria bacterium]
MIEFLELFAPFSRKTLGAIQTMLTKRFAMKTHCVRDKKPAADQCPSGDERITSIIPAYLSKKRLEELTWDDLATILNK